MRLFWGASMNGWRIWGLWIAKKYYLGFSITDSNYKP